MAIERKLITVLFCDLVGSTALGERLDPEAVQSVQQAYFDRMRTVIEQFGGTVEKFAGDAVVAVFGVPTLHEDDAERAVRCALAMQDALVGLTDTLRPRFGIELAFRIGVQSGEAVISGSVDALATGDVMNTAARLEQRAASGQVLVGHETVLLTSDVIDYGDEIQVEAKGKADPVRAQPARRVRTQRKRVRSPLVGRSAELELMAAALERAIARGELQKVLLVGEPGIGKTRLAEEFASRASGRAVVLLGACLPYGEGNTWRPFEELVRNEVGIGDADGDAQVLAKLNAALAPRHTPDELSLVVPQLAALVGAATTGITSEQELLWALGRYLRAVAARGPVVLMLDDLHWADGTLLRAVFELLPAISAVPSVAILQGRPELVERSAGLDREEPMQVIRLDGLSPEESASLVDNLAAARGNPWADEVRAAVLERGDGSPLFLEEVAAMAEGEGLQAGVPHSLRALIAARLDLLPADAKRIAQVAAVVGDVFPEDAVVAVAGIDRAPSAIEELRSRGFVDRESAGFGGQRRFAFHHALIREVTYLSLAKIERSELHRRVASWLEPHAERRHELVLGIAHHLEQACSLRSEVFPVEGAEPELVVTTVDALRTAASWAGANAGARESIELLRRAISIAGEERNLAQLATAQLAAMLARSGSPESVALAGEVLAGEDGASEAAALASLALAEEARSRSDGATMIAQGTRALELAQLLGLRMVEVEALDIIGLAETWSGRLTASVERRRRATEIALELGDLPRAAWGMGGYSAIGLLHLGRLDDAERQLAEAMRIATESGSLRALESVHAATCFLRRAQDRLEEAVEHGRERLKSAERLGERLWLFNSLVMTLARPLIELGRLDEAWECLDRAFQISHETRSDMEEEVRLGRVAILLLRGREDEAAEEAKHIDTNGDLNSEIAELRAAQGLEAEADEIWRRLLETFASSEDRLDRAELGIGYARFLARCGRSGEARAQLAAADDLVQGTGAKFYERRIEEVRALLSPPA